MRITKLETIIVKPRWVFLKIHTDEGLVGLGEPTLENRAYTIVTAISEIEPYLIGKDPTRVVHHWQAIYKHAFYRGGPLLTSALSGVEHALWDLAGKAAGVPVYKLLGGPLRDRIKLYAHARGETPEALAAHGRELVAQGFIALKTVIRGPRPIRTIETPAYIDQMVARIDALRSAVGNEIDIGIDFHGAISPQSAGVLIKALEAYSPLFYEEIVQSQNLEVMADLARKTHVPIAAGERLYTKWDFRKLLEAGAASVLQPDLSHAGGIFEGRIIAGMAESYYAAIAPHCPLGPISLAACLQLDAAIPNFLAQEQVHLGEGYLRTPFVMEAGYLPLPTAPGLGIELDDEAVAAQIGEPRRHPGLFDPDDGAAIDH
jgi:galactonate dehydratase